ncbi:hypothetical protein [Desulforamulus hydrothermalis]|uniref:Phage tail tape measure protein domain-containing protein n=1 Tax=Desulforamulus hydrothermalis Lam5 = DSM 18033 TaxID=1121428 RepID=K8E9L9_9FIRM|nr:hypothetical protein [Desulforamulus hydrothermalis]CCO08278.1 hypothetical protein DESHY_20147 [Desulforamulus hydrothermalis Lam5 = DSM 18033]SHH37518.1 hypothetical protein SAMN02745177_02343 [Desulforamulus hydrothermalis Lam5 = DSM 18033]
MAETIKGLNVVIGSDTVGLNKALGDVNKNARNIQSELKQVEKLLKLDPSNTELLSQKQKLLADAVENSKEKLDRLRSVQEQINKQFAKGDISEGQYRAFQREVVKAEQELKRFENRIADAEKKSKDLGKTIQDIGEKAGNIGNKLTLGVTAPLVGFATLATEATQELRTELAKLETNAQMAGANIEVVNQAYRDMYAITGELDSNVEGLSNLLAAGFDGTQMTQAMEMVAGAAIKFKDTLKFEGIADGLQETLATGAAIGPFAELLDRSSVSLDEFNEGLQESIKQGKQQQYILDTLAKLGLKETYDAYTKNNKALVDGAKATYDLQLATAELSDTLMPIKTELVKKTTELIKAYNELTPESKNAVLALTGVAVAAGPVLTIIEKITKIWPVLTAGLTTIGGPAAITIGVLGALGVAFVSYKEKIDAAIMSFDTWMRQQSWFKAIGGAQLSDFNFPKQSVADFKKLENEMGAFKAPTIQAPKLDISKYMLKVSDVAKSTGATAAKAAEDTRAAWEKTADILGVRLQIIEAQYDTLSNSTAQSSDKTRSLVTELQGLYQQLDMQQKIVAAVNEGYLASVKAKGEDAEETIKLALRLEQEKRAQSELEKEIRETNQAIKDHAKELRDLAQEVSEVERKYREELADALEEYQEKVREVNQRVIEEEKKLTEQYEQELNNRTKSLSNFVGLFEAVATRDVSGKELLDNLRGQVDAFEKWQENIADLAAKGVDEGLIEELRQMGPKAGPEIAALNTLTDEQLQEYVTLWREKNEMAREEAITQLEQQRQEMYQKLSEIRQDAQKQLEAYRVEWEKKNAEIRKNAEEELKRIEDRFKEISEAGSRYGVSLMTNFIDGIEGQFDRLERTLERMAEMVDSYMPHSPAKRGPLRKIMEWGPSLVGSLIEGINDSLPALESTVSRMAASTSPMAMAGGGDTNYHYGGNSFTFYVSSGWEEIERELRRRGVRI